MFSFGAAEFKKL